MMNDSQLPQRILIIKLTGMDEILLSTPILAALKAKYPEAEITWAVDTHSAEVLRKNPYIDNLFEIEQGPWIRLLKRGNLKKFWRKSTRMRRDLLDHSFDVVLNLSPNDWWTLVLLTAPERIALFPTKQANWTARWHTKVLTRVNDTDHDVIHALSAARALGCSSDDVKLTIGHTVSEAPFAERFWEVKQFTDAVATVVLAPFAEFENRNWETERWANLGSWLVEQYKAQVIVLSNDGHDEDAQKLVEILGTKNVVAATDMKLRESVAILRKADLVITGESFEMYAAAALEKPFIALFGAGMPQRRFPMDADGTLIFKQIECSPCQNVNCRNREFRQCMKAITLDDVQKAVAHRLAKWAQTPNSRSNPLMPSP